jgi:hypothetical protein
MLPKATDAVAESYVKLEVAGYVSAAPKTDTASIAGFVRHAYQWGWLAGGDMNQLTTRNPALTLYRLADKATAFLPKRLDVGDVINPTQALFNLGGTPLTAITVQALAHAGIRGGVLDDASLLADFRAMIHAEAQFPPWFLGKLDQYVAQQAAENLALPALSIKEGAHVFFDINATQDGAAVSLYNTHGLSLYSLHIPKADDGNSIMLRDALRLLSDTLQAMEVFHTAPEDLLRGGFHFEDDIVELRNCIGEDATPDTVMAHLRGLVTDCLKDEGFDASELSNLSLEEILEAEDFEGAADFLKDQYLSLYCRNGYTNAEFTLVEWTEQIAGLLVADHWTTVTALPEHLRLATGGESALQKKARWKALAAHFQDTIQALSVQLGTLVPQTITALQSVQHWLSVRAENGVVNTFLEDQDDNMDAIPFEHTFLIAANGGDEGALSSMEACFLLALEEEAMQLGSGCRSALVSMAEGFETFNKVAEMAVTYATLAEAMARLSEAREVEK